MYSQRLLDHFRNPRNAGELAPPAVSVDAMNPVCGDKLRLWVRFDGDTVAEARFQARGCTASMAAASALTELLPGKSRADLAGLEWTDIAAALDGLPSTSTHAALLCIDAVRALL